MPRYSKRRKRGKNEKRAPAVISPLRTNKAPVDTQWKHRYKQAQRGQLYPVMPRHHLPFPPKFIGTHDFSFQGWGCGNFGVLGTGNRKIAPLPSRVLSPAEFQEENVVIDVNNSDFMQLMLRRAEQFRCNFKVDSGKTLTVYLGNGQTYAAGDQNLEPERVKGLEDVHIHDISCGSMSHFATAGVPVVLRKRVKKLRSIRRQMKELKKSLPAKHPYFTDEIMSKIDADTKEAQQQLNEATRRMGQVFAWGNNRYGQLGTGRLYTYKQDEVRPDGSTIVRPKKQMVMRYVQVIESKHSDDEDVPGTNAAAGPYDDVKAVATALQKSSLAAEKQETTPVPGAEVASEPKDNDEMPEVETEAQELTVFLKRDIPRGKEKDVEEVIEIGSAYPLERSLFEYNNVSVVAAGSRHSLAITEGGRLYSWGLGRHGRLGLGSTDTMHKPVLVAQFFGASGAVPFDQVRVTAAAAGGRHSACLTSDGAVYTWGDGSSGQLGHAVFSPSDESQQEELRTCATAPQLLAALSPPKSPCLVRQLSLGEAYSVFLSHPHQRCFKGTKRTKKVSTIYTCGDGKYGQLGLGRPPFHRASYRAPTKSEDGFTVPSTSVGAPKPVRGCLEWEHVVEVAAGLRHCLALTLDGRMFAWGYGAHGQIGVGDRTVRMTPQRISMPRPKPKFNLPTAALPYKKRHAPVVAPREPLKSRYLSNKEWRANMARQPDEAFVCAIGTGEKQSFCASLFSGQYMTSKRAQVVDRHLARLKIRREKARRQMAEKRRMEEAAENFEEYEPEEPPSDEEEEKLVQQDIFIHCVRNRKPEHVPVHIFLRLPGIGIVCSSCARHFSLRWWYVWRTVPPIEIVWRDQDQYCEYGTRQRCERMFPVLELPSTAPPSTQRVPWVRHVPRFGLAKDLPPLVSRLVGEGDRQRFWQKYQMALEAGDEEEEEVEEVEVEDKEDAEEETDEVEVDAAPGGTIAVDVALGYPIVDDGSSTSLSDSKKKKPKRKKSGRKPIESDAHAHTESSAQNGEASLDEDVQVEMDDALGYPIVVDEALDYPIVSDTAAAEESATPTNKHKTVTKNSGKKKKHLGKTGSFSRRLLQSPK